MEGLRPDCHTHCMRDDNCPKENRPEDCTTCELYCPTPVWMKYRNPETDAKPQFRRFQGVTLHYQPEFAIEEPDFGKDLLKEAARAMREQHVKAIDTLDQKMVEACIQAAREEGVCLTLLDKNFIVDAIKEKMEREGLMNE